ncbi:MAG: ABC transporter permease [Ilumatobacteraceae bacterium]
MNGAALLAGAGLRGRRRLGIVTTLAVVCLASLGMAAGATVSRHGAPVLDAAADDANVAHLVLLGDPVALRRMTADPEVVASSGPFPTVGADLLTADETIPMQIAGLDSPDIEVNRPPMRAGRWAASADEIVLDRSLAADLSIALHDEVVLQIEGRTTDFEVVGTAVNFTDCFYPQCDPGRAWVTRHGMARLGRAAGDYAQVWLRFDSPEQADPFVQRQLAAGATGISGSESWLDTRADFLTLDRVFGAFVAAFGLFVLAVSAVVIAGSTAVRVVARRREIALLGAVGCTPRQVMSGLVLEQVVLGLVASVVGWALAGLLAPSLQLGIGRTLGPQDPTWSLWALVATAAVITALLVLATIVPARAAARRPVTDVLRDVPRERVSWMNRRSRGLPRRVAWLGAKEAASQPARSALASLAIVVAVIGSMVSIGFIGGINRVAADPARAGDPWDVALVPGEVAPEDVGAALASVDGVQSWFTDMQRRSTLDGGAFLSVATAGDPAAADYRIAGGRAMASAGEAIAGYGFLTRFGVAVGDEVSILAGTTPLDLEIVGWYRETEDSGEVLRYRFETLAAAEPGVRPDVYRITAQPDTTRERLAAELAAALGPTVHTEVLDTGVSDLAPLMAVLWLIAVVLLTMAGVNLLTMMLTATREAARQTGVQLAVGFTPRQVVAQGAVAGLVLGIVSAVVAVPAGLWIFRMLSDSVSTSLGVGPGWMPAPATWSVVVLAVAACVVSAALGALAAARITRRSASELVRSE